jgi:hypothetical protein
MFESYFSKQCTALVGANGRALSGDALAAAETALTEAKRAGLKIWSDRNGFIHTRRRALFASSVQLVDATGAPVRICGRQVANQAKFCSKCGSPAPGGWWRCGGCGMHIGNESQTCPHCGQSQHAEKRLDMSGGVWEKQEEVFAERFEFPDLEPRLGNGLNVQESQYALLLQGGAVIETLRPGFYPKTGIDAKTLAESGRWSIVMVDSSEFALPVCVEKLETRDDITADLHLVLALEFDPEGAKEFMRNLMGSCLMLNNDALTASLGYDEISRSVMQTVDAAARSFCNTVTVAELFKDADIRLKLENHIAQAMIRSLGAVGLKFVRLKESEFKSEVFDKLRGMSGQLETKRREIEFMRRADELANDATRREALREHEMEEYITQLAHEKGIRDDLREQELERLRTKWRREKERGELEYQNETREIRQESDQAFQVRQAEHEEQLLDLHHREELERRIAAQKNSVEYMQLDAQIRDIRLETEKKKSAVEQEAAGWLKLKEQKRAAEHERKLEMLNAAQGADISAMLMAEEDPEKRAQLLKFHELELQTKMTPELLLAAAAANGNPAAAEALSRMNRDQLEAIERSKQENKEVYERMLQMDERMFNSALENIVKNNVPHPAPTTTTQFIK